MLVLTRHIDQTVVINGNVTVQVLGVETFHGKVRVKLGIVAPRDVTILRGELGEYENQPWDEASLERLLLAVEEVPL